MWRSFRSWPWVARWASYVAAGLVLVLVAASVTAVVVVRRSMPQTSGEQTLAGLDAEVQVLRDENGIAQIYADSTDDLMRAQGYVHAQDRFFEMDVRRHITAGRMAELFGEPALETDKFVRTMGWRRVAEQELALLESDTRAAMEAYSEGVNAYLGERSLSQLSLEYTVLGLTGLEYEPEEWTPVDSLAWLKAMAWDLRGNMEDEIARVLLAVNHPEQDVAALYPGYPYDRHAPIVRRGAVVDGRFEPDASGPGSRNPARPAYGAEVVEALEGLQRGLERMPELVGRGSGIGSNSWVVGPEHSATGQPLLANDPHLGTSLPGIWYQVGLHCTTVSAECPYDVSGFSFSGVPGVVIGHNQDIAWGFTNLGPDVTDLFLERVEDGKWLYDDRYRPLKVRTETIEVRDGEDFELTIRETDHGPLLSDVSAELSTVGANAEVTKAPDRGNGFAVALRWTALDPAPTADAILALNRAGDWDEFRAAAADFSVPAQNLVYADREGHIGYQAPGRVPIRKSGNDGTVPSAGWLPENDWSDRDVPFDALPMVLDPDEGFIVTANQAVVGRDYPYFLTDDWDSGYRAQRIRELIQAEADVSLDEMLELQLDDHNSLAEELVPYLLDIRLPRGYYSAGQELLADWDFRQGADSAAAAYFNVVWSNLLRLTFHDEIRESLWPDGGDRWWLAVTGLLREPAGTWWDDRRTSNIETRDQVLRTALMDARDELVRRQSLDPGDWSWGRLHRMDLRSQTLGESGVGAVEWLFNRDGYRIGGGGSIVNATSWDAAQGYEVTAAPSMRMVVSMADLDESRWVNLSGVSGHAFDDHFTDQTDLFVEGRTLAWPFSREAVDEAAEDTLTLVPSD
ncbi:penicillin acylase family protein [Nocardioides donggukensis]|uniref:Penicillin acylase family protein n=1 Tax=Nocardioides donggukensis TaxID=2774019 RepID=A0A927K687_9ACTN|nr:penicillin acylase family protein [Nocardioides donggukensis]MBD8870696.1 penicillin acylase family protein [Nocardioides donggukensis]